MSDFDDDDRDACYWPSLEEIQTLVRQAGGSRAKLLEIAYYVARLIEAIWHRMNGR